MSRPVIDEAAVEEQLADEARAYAFLCWSNAWHLTVAAHLRVGDVRAVSLRAGLESHARYFAALAPHVRAVLGS